MTKTIKSDERLLKILRVLREKETAGVTELAAGTKLPKSTVHVHLATLEENNFVVKKDGKYQIGLQFLNFGKAVQKNNPLYRVVKEKTEELAQKTGEQAWCLVEEHNQAIYLYGSHGDRAIQTHAHVGKREELPNLAGGRAILANLPEAQREKVINAYPFDNDCELPFSDREGLIERLEQIQTDEIALNTESYVKGVNAVGAPIIDNTGEVYGALTIFGPANRLKEEYIRSEISDLLLGVTNEIGINLTYR